MKVTTLPTPELGLMAATRGMAGAGAAILLSKNMDDKKRKIIGWPLLAVGVLSTIPFVMHIFKNTSDLVKEQAKPTTKPRYKTMAGSRSKVN